MNRLEGRLPRLRAILQQTLDILIRRWLGGELSDTEFTESVALAVAKSRTRAQAVGRHLAGEELAAQIGAPVTGLPPVAGAGALDRLIQAVATIVADFRAGFAAGKEEEARRQAQQRLERLGRSETSQAAQDAVTDVIRHDSRVEGWVRDLNDGACELCEHWSRNGRIWPKDYVMPRHTGCDCFPRPVTATTIQNPTSKAWKRSDRDKEKTT